MEYELTVRNIKDIYGNEISVGISEGKIKTLSAPQLSNAKITVDGEGLCIIPGLVDLHVHFREPGFCEKEDIITGSNAAAAGGVTSVFCMPNTKPVCDNADVLQYISERAKAAKCRIFPVAAITKGLESRELCDFATLKDSGAYAFSDDGKPVMTAQLLREGMLEAKKNDLLFMSHCEEMSLAAGGSVNEGKISKQLGLKGIPNSAEDLIIARDILLAGETGCRLHICHVSTKGGVEIIRTAKRLGINVTAETCPHYFALNENAVLKYGTRAKMNPPLRTEKDVNAIIEGLCDGTLDCISTDHAPHTEAEKNVEFSKAPNGIIGLQTSFAVAYTALVKTGIIPLEKLIYLMSERPAEITGIDRFGIGSLKEGNAADFALVRLDSEYTLSAKELCGKSRNCPFLDIPLCARAMKTFVGGECVFTAPKL